MSKSSPQQILSRKHGGFRLGGENQSEASFLIWKVQQMIKKEWKRTMGGRGDIIIESAWGHNVGGLGLKAWQLHYCTSYSVI